MDTRRKSKGGRQAAAPVEPARDQKAATDWKWRYTKKAKDVVHGFMAEVHESGDQAFRPRSGAKSEDTES